MTATLQEYEFPLSAQQTRLWIIEQLDPGNAAYHVPITLRIKGELDVGALSAAVQCIVDRHETLRTRYDANARVQLVAESWTVTPDVVDLGELSGPDREAELARVKRDAARRPFDLWSAAPLRVTLIRLSPTEHVLVVVVHHIACDGWSIGVLAGELSAAYTALRAGREPALPELPVQYGDFAVWQRDRLSGESLRTELEHWSGVLAGAPLALNLPTDRPRPAHPSFDGGRVKRVLDAAIASRIEEFASANGVSLYMVLLAAYAIVLTRLSDQDTVIVGTATAGRTRPEIENLVGCFIDVLPLRVDVSAVDTVAELLARVRRVCLDAYAHQDLPFERLVDHLAPARDPARGPIFQVMLNLHDTPTAELSWPGLEVTGETPEPGVAKYDLTLDVHRGPDGLTLDIEYNQDVFEPATVSRLTERISGVLTWFCAAGPDTPLFEVDITTADERAQVVGTTATPTRDTATPTRDTATPTRDTATPMGDAATPVGGAATPVGGVASPVGGAASPVGGVASPVGDVAPRVRDTAPRVRDTAPRVRDTAPRVRDMRDSRVSHSGRCVARSPDGGRAELVASALVGRGVGRGDVVGVLVPAESVGVVLSGVWLAGAVAVPLDPELSLARLGFIVSDSGARVVVSCVDLADRVPGSGVPVLLVEGLLAGAGTGGPVGDRAEVGYTPTDPALIEYPAGLVVSHRALRAPDIRLVLDERLRPVPTGVVGELFLAGPGMPDGYHRKARLTAERFVPSPFTAGARLFRTGELARMTADRSAPVVGERVTVRGHRLYLTEIEAKIAAHPGVVEAAVDVRDDALVAYVVGGADVGELRDLPAYLIPAIVPIDAIPRDEHGRLDRDALPAPAGREAAQPVEPRNPAETMVLDCFRRVLGKPNLGVTDDFFDHGGSSITATTLLVELERASGQRLVLRELFRQTTAEAVAARLSPPVENLTCAPVHPKAWSPGHVLVTQLGGPLWPALVERLLAEPDTEVTVLVADDRPRLSGIDLSWYGDRLHTIAGDPRRERLGLPEDRYTAFAEDVAAVYHASPDGIREVIRFAATGTGKALHYLRTLDAAEAIAEDLTGDPAEDLVFRAAGRGQPVTITRAWPGLLTRYLDEALRTGRLPDLPGLPLLPPEQLADAIVRIGRTERADGQVVNLATPVRMADVVETLAELGRPIELVPATADPPRIEARAAGALLGTPFTGPTLPYLRKAIAHLEQGDR